MAQSIHGNWLHDACIIRRIASAQYV